MKRGLCEIVLAVIFGCAGLTACAGHKPTPDEAEIAGGDLDAGHLLSGSESTSKANVGTTLQAPAAAPAPRGVDPKAKRTYRDGVSDALAGDCRKAAEKFEDALREDGSFAWAAYDLGVCQERLGLPGKAKESYRRALSASPALLEASENLTRLLLRLGQTAEAETELRSRLGQPNAPQALHAQLAEVLEAEGRFDDSAAEAKFVLKTDERNVPAMLVLAQIYFDQKRFELSRMVAENARQIDPQSARVYNLIGALDLIDKNRNLAIEDFKKATEVREDFPEAQNNLGALLVAAQDFPAAIKHLELAVRDAPTGIEPHLNLGNAYRGDKQYDHAKAEYERVLAIDPRQNDAYFNLGVLFLDGEPSGLAPLDRLNQSITYFEKFRSTGGQDPKLDQYLKDAQKAISQEKRRQEVEAKNKLRKDADAKKKATTPQEGPSANSNPRSVGPNAGPMAPSGSKLLDTGPASARPTPLLGDKLQGGK